MASKNRGRERLVICTSCGRRVPRDKAVFYTRTTVFSTDLRGGEDIRTMIRSDEQFCPSCGKHKGIYAKKIRQAVVASERAKLRSKSTYNRRDSDAGGMYRPREHASQSSQ